tara:strand:- start:13440 stop:14432 length:993 start_codon:yes stop_codon:yes gene_type:complete
MLSPFQNIDYYGHNEIMLQLDTLFVGGKLNTSLMFCGPKGIGKSTMAFRFANYLLSKESNKFINYKIDIENPTNNQIKNLSHPNLIYINNENTEEGFETEIKIDQVRSLRDKLKSKTLNDSYRIIIIDTIDDLNKSSNNALLKLLEEPPESTLFLLISNNLNLISETISSRCIKLKFKHLNEKDTQNILSIANIKIDKSTIKSVFDGKYLTPGYIIFLLENDIDQIIDDFKLFISLIGKKKYSRIIQLSKLYSQKENSLKFQIFIEIILIWIQRTAVKYDKTDTNNIYLLKLITFWEKYNNKYKQLLEMNYNKEEFILSLFRDIDNTIKI